MRTGMPVRTRLASYHHYLFSNRVLYLALAIPETRRSAYGKAVRPLAAFDVNERGLLR
jgi:hypothetical protein